MFHSDAVSPTDASFFLRTPITISLELYAAPQGAW